MQLLGPVYVAHGPRLQYWVDKRVDNRGNFDAFVVRTYEPGRSYGHLVPTTFHGNFPTIEEARAEAQYQARVEKVTQLIQGN